WKRRKRKAHSVNEQNNALRQHQTAEPRDSHMELSRPNHEDQIPAANQSKRSCCHPEPIIKHPVVTDWLRAQTLQSLRCCLPTEEHSKHGNAPRESREAEKQSQESKVHMNGCCLRARMRLNK